MFPFLGSTKQQPKTQAAAAPPRPQVCRVPLAATSHLLQAGEARRAETGASHRQDSQDRGCREQWVAQDRF